MINPFKYLYHNIFSPQFKNKIEMLRYPEMNPKNAYLPIFNEHETIFVHIPKTAGTSVSQAIYEEQPWHHPIDLYFKLDEEKCNNYFKFAFVRNPWDRLYSTFLYAKKISHPIYHGPLSEIAKLASFEEFVMQWCTQDKINKHFFLKPQFHFLTIDGKNLAVDFIGYFENIDEDFEHLCQKLGIKKHLPKMNQSQKKDDVQKIYTLEMKNRVAELYSQDLQHFDYSLESVG